MAESTGAQVLTVRDAQPRSVDLALVQRALGLIDDEVCQLFGVSKEVAEHWMHGASLPLLYAIKLDDILPHVHHLLRIFEPDRLPAVLRRETELFDGGTALSRILRGEIAEVVDAYERLLTYAS